MQDDYRAKYKLTNEQLERFAEEFRVRTGNETVDRVDILKFFELGWIWTLKGNKKLQYFEVEDYVLGDRDAEATSDETSATIRVKQSIGKAVKDFLRLGLESTKARRGVFTLTHELGHVVLCHEFAPRGRKAAGSQEAKRPNVEVFESSERQANYWTGAVLMGRSLLKRTDTPDGVSARCGVSVDAAKVRLGQLFKQKSPAVINGFKQLSDFLQNQPAAVPQTVDKSQSLVGDTLKLMTQNESARRCPKCGQNTLLQNYGNNYSCLNVMCGAKNITLPEGD